MFQLHDIRETRFYKDAKEDGLNEAIVKMAANKMSAAKIAGILEVDIAHVTQVLAAARKDQ
ncbi:MAG TPA: hypothetical protein VE988_04420 [Gemmataceae bacterium]|nr:hypothetical protein [Gemmataceae bacterium]